MKKTIDISPRLAEMMRTDEAHLTTTLERFAYLLRKATKENEETFTDRMWALMAKAMEAARFDPRLGPIETLAGSVEQEARLEDLDSFYHVDLDALLIKIRDLDTIQAWAVVEALTIAHLPGVDADHEPWWTIAGRKEILARGASGKKRKHSPAKVAEKPTVSAVLTHEHESVHPASINGMERSAGAGSD